MEKIETPQHKGFPWRWLLLGFAFVLTVVWLFLTPEGLLGKADAVGYSVCHRISVRSFHIGERPLPLCARCSGMFLGALLGLVYQAAQGKKGKMPPNSKAFIYQHQSMIAKPAGWLSAPIILTFFDVCSDCGTVYCVHAEERVVVPGSKLPPSGQGFSNS